MTNGLKEALLLVASLPQRLLLAIALLYTRLADLVLRDKALISLEKLVSRKFDERIAIVKHQSTLGETFEMRFYAPNDICRYRATTFSSKEPETLEWLENNPGLTLWDVGANIGLYACYYAGACGGNVVAFEPSPFNLRQLVKNINVNKLDSTIQVVTNPLSNVTGPNSFLLGDLTEGGALSAFGVDHGFDGAPMRTTNSFVATGFTGDKLVADEVCPFPNLIKLDVDGIEHLVLSGMATILNDPRCLSVLVEINDEFEAQSKQSSQLLTEAGFVMQKKTHGKILENSPKFVSTFNQIWQRPSGIVNV